MNPGKQVVFKRDNRLKSKVILCKIIIIDSGNCIKKKGYFNQNQMVKE